MYFNLVHKHKHNSAFSSPFLFEYLGSGTSCVSRVHSLSTLLDYMYHMGSIEPEEFEINPSVK